MHNQNFSKQAIALGVAVFALIFVLGGTASAQKFVNLNPENMDPRLPITGLRTPDASSNRLTTGGLTVNNLLFSPRFYLTLGLLPNIFGLFDDGVACMSLNPGTPVPYFDGIPFNMNTLDAVDFDTVIGAGATTADLMYFSVSQATWLTGDGKNLFVKPGDVAVMEMAVCGFAPFFSGQNINLPDVDACSVSGNVLWFSPRHDWFYTGGPGAPLFLYEEDLAQLNMLTGVISFFKRGQDIGINSLDGADVELQTNRAGSNVTFNMYFSVRVPQWVFPVLPLIGSPFYMEDGDVACLNLLTNELFLVLKGRQKFIYSIDALAVGEFMDNSSSP